MTEQFEYRKIDNDEILKATKIIFDALKTGGVDHATGYCAMQAILDEAKALGHFDSIIVTEEENIKHFVPKPNLDIN